MTEDQVADIIGYLRSISYVLAGLFLVQLGRLVVETREK